MLLLFVKGHCFCGTGNRIRQHLVDLYEHKNEPSRRFWLKQKTNVDFAHCSLFYHVYDDRTTNKIYK